MNFNGVKCDFYIGTNAGSNLSSDIINATSSITIVSPYLSPNKLEDLIQCHHKGIEVKLLTTFPLSSVNKNNNYDYIYNLISQKKIIDDIKNNSYNKWVLFYKVILFFNFFLFLSIFPLVYYFKNRKILYVISGVIFIKFFQNFLIRKIKNIKVYSYEYHNLFPFKVHYKGKSKELVHSKIFIIDNKIAYVGSLNFTNNGFSKNYESLIKTTDPQFINDLNKEINSLFWSSQWSYKNLQNWGAELYSEPLNNWK